MKPALADVLTAQAEAHDIVALGYNPDQERDDHGRFGSGAGAAAKSDADKDTKAAKYASDAARGASFDAASPKGYRAAADAHDAAARAHLAASESQERVGNKAAAAEHDKAAADHRQSANGEVAKAKLVANNQKVDAAYAEHKTAIHEHLDRIAKEVDKAAASGKPDWGDVGSMGHVHDQLRDIATKTGEPVKDTTNPRNKDSGTAFAEKVAAVRPKSRQLGARGRRPAFSQPARGRPLLTRQTRRVW